MIPAWYLSWIIPLSFLLGLFVAALLSANHYDDDGGIGETDDDDEDDEDDDGSDDIWAARIGAFLVGLLVGMAGMGVAIYFITNDFATLFT